MVLPPLSSFLEVSNPPSVVECCEDSINAEREIGNKRVLIDHDFEGTASKACNNGQSNHYAKKSTITRRMQ